MKNSRTIPSLLGMSIVIVVVISGVATAQNPNAAPTEDQSIRPFHFKATDATLADLKRRIAATRWPEKETVTDSSQGAQLATIKALAKYWGNAYDWRKYEDTRKAYPQFITNIDVLNIHFIHVRSKTPSALPMIITHGWPG